MLPIPFDGLFTISPGSRLAVPVTLSPGPIRAGSIDAVMECHTNELSGEVPLTTITRTLVEDGEPCVDPGAANTLRR